MIAEVLPVILAVSMLIGAGLNLAAPGFVRTEFARWGFSPVLRVAVGLAELAAALMLLWSPLRPFGAALALAVLVGVLGTLGRDRAWLRMEYPAVLAALALLVLAGR